MPAGRPTRLTKAKIKNIANAIRRGNYIETACALEGYERKTMYDWLKVATRLQEEFSKTGERSITKHEALCLELSDAVKKALAESEDRDLRLIDEAAHGMPETKTVEKYERDPKTGRMRLVEKTETHTVVKDWHAAAWRRERRDPQKWGRRRVEISAPTEDVDIEWETEDADEDPSQD